MERDIDKRQTVEDAVKDDNDAVAVYVDSANSGKDDITPVTVTVKRSEAAEVENAVSYTHLTLPTILRV